jgi:hypothetical protein
MRPEYLIIPFLALWIGLAFGADSTFLRPDPELTPGVADPALTSNVLCAKKFTTRDVRSVTATMKRQVYARYGRRNHKGICARSKRGCEIDHLISLELGGANDVENLWPEPFGKPSGAEIKDVLENRLHKLVCAGKLDLAEAQKCISTDWISCSKRMR